MLKKEKFFSIINLFIFFFRSHISVSFFIKKIKLFFFLYFKSYFFNKNLLFFIFNNFFKNNFSKNVILQKNTSIVSNDLQGFFFYKFLNLGFLQNFFFKFGACSELKFFNIFFFFFLKKNKLVLKNENIVFFQYSVDFLKNFLENFIKKYIYIKIQNSSYFFMYIFDDIDILFAKIKQYQHVFSTKFSLRSLVEISVLTLFTKDLKYLHNWFVLNLERCHFRDHKKFFQFFKIYLIRFFSLFFIKYNCLGFKLNVAGKISGAGGSKKKKFHVYWGANSLVTKRDKFLSSCGQIRTLSGVLGFNFVLLYS